MFTSILTNTTSGLTITAVLICLGVSLLCGFILSYIYRVCENPNKGFSITLVILPAIVQLIILMVNGNLGVGVAVAGSFSLVRFRSLPGKASEILMVFIAMGVGLCTGMGYVWLALAATIILACVYLLFEKTSILDMSATTRMLRVTIPEDLDYNEVFDEVFKEYTNKVELETVKTINLGTMYQIEYDIQLKDTNKEKEMIDAIRVRNGNLPVISSRTATVQTEL